MDTDLLKKYWSDRIGPIVFSTVDDKGIPNSIYATCVKKIDHNKIAIANNYFEKTLNNIKEGSFGTILFMTHNDEALQVKGVVDYYEDGDFYEKMKIWNPVKHPGHGVAVLTVEQIFTSSVLK